MALDLRTLLDPNTTAVVTSECQNGVLGPETSLPDLAAAARRVSAARPMRAGAGHT